MKDFFEIETIVLEQAEKFDVDSVYFNTDEKGNSFPAVFLKNVESFDSVALQVDVSV